MIPIDTKTKYCATFSNTIGILHIPHKAKLKRVISGTEWFQIEKFTEQN